MGKMGTKNLILVPMETKVPKWGPTWEQWEGCRKKTYKVWSFTKPGVGVSRRVVKNQTSILEK